MVTRYFGGIKLGAGGLTRTYAKAVSEAIKAAGLSRMVPMGDYAFTWSIDDVGRVLNHLYGKALFLSKMFSMMPKQPLSLPVSAPIGGT